MASRVRKNATQKKAMAEGKPDPRALNSLAMPPPALHERAITLVPDLPISENSTWVAILYHSVQRLQDIRSTDDFMWMKCHGKITVRTLRHYYFTRQPLDDFQFKHVNYYPEEECQVSLLRQRSPWQENVVVLRAITADNTDNVDRDDLDYKVIREGLGDDVSTWEANGLSADTAIEILSDKAVDDDEVQFCGQRPVPITVDDSTATPQPAQEQPSAAPSRPETPLVPAADIPDTFVCSAVHPARTCVKKPWTRKGIDEVPLCTSCVIGLWVFWQESDWHRPADITPEQLTTMPDKIQRLIEAEMATKDQRSRYVPQDYNTDAPLDSPFAAHLGRSIRSGAGDRHDQVQLGDLCQLPPPAGLSDQSLSSGVSSPAAARVSRMQAAAAAARPQVADSTAAGAAQSAQAPHPAQTPQPAAQIPQPARAQIIRSGSAELNMPPNFATPLQQIQHAQASHATFPARTMHPYPPGFGYGYPGSAPAFAAQHTYNLAPVENSARAAQPTNFANPGILSSPYQPPVPRNKAGTKRKAKTRRGRKSNKRQRQSSSDAEGEAEASEDEEDLEEVVRREERQRGRGEDDSGDDEYVDGMKVVMDYKKPPSNEKRERAGNGRGAYKQGYIEDDGDDFGDEESAVESDVDGDYEDDDSDGDYEG